MKYVPYTNTALSTRSITHRNILDSQHTNIINLKSVKRILDALLENGHMKRTQLSTKTGMNYERCMKYVNTLKVIKLVEVILDKSYSYVIITQTGKEISNLLECI